VLQAGPGTDPANWARQALCSACSHAGCAVELLGMGMLGMLVSMCSADQQGTHSMKLASRALQQLAQHSSLAQAVCTAEVLHALVAQLVAAAGQQLAAMHAHNKDGDAGNSSSSSSSIAQQGECGVHHLAEALADLAGLPSGRAHLATGAGVLVQLLEALLQLGRQAGQVMPLAASVCSLVARLVESSDQGPGLQQQWPGLAAALLQVLESAGAAAAHGAALRALEVAVRRQPGLVQQLRWVA
jgi:hypothetical protein